ncbi:ABC transporter substrate-binding protein [Streptococcus sp. DD13]|uniref:ABC transporter substrate-binding protein n=1 Tax=Streptococcus sp. DD13 TaxID=1777881 RepID=UPI00079856C7|nr:ABC transporter substrate-binding protein [Streptococcus sp. DD13]KXT78161.1 Oligopeptide ABC transporter, periplasmic oligopeptide-binding protein OppA [Streptococcus sp. DD13]
MKKKKWLLGFLSLAAVATLAACGGGSSSSSSSSNASNDTFTYAINSNPESTNPINTSDRWGLTLTNYIYSPLLRVNPDGSYKNELAEGYEIASDGLSITVKLRQDVKWSDGEKFTADDVIFTYQKKADKANGNATHLYINDKPVKFEKVDDYTVRFVLPEVSAPALDNIVTETYILPEHAYKNVKDFSGKELDVTPVGTGPYKFVEYKNGEYIRLEANENYYGGAPKIKNFILRIISNPETTKTALQTGEVDASYILPTDIKDYDKSSIDTYAYTENRVGYMGLNTASDELKDVRVRQAILYALDKNEMNKAAYVDSDYFETPYSFLPVANPYRTDQVEKYEQNLDRSRQLLKEAGVNNLKLSIGYTSSDAAQSLQATLIQEQLKKVGIDVELQGGDASAVSTEIRKDKPKYNLFLNGYIMGNDPDQYARLFTTGGKSNYFKLKSATVDNLFKQGAVELNTEKRKEIYNTLQSEIAKEAVIYPIVDNKKVLAVNKRITGVEDAKLVPIYTFEDPSKLSIAK